MKITSPIANTKTYFTTPEPEEITPEVVEPRKYTITGDSIIHFGKFKGEKHEVLLYNGNYKYARWIMEQSDFKCSDTRDWLLAHFAERALHI